MGIGVRSYRIKFAKEVQVFNTESVKASDANLGTPLIVHISISGKELLCCKFSQQKLTVKCHVIKHFVLGAYTQVHLLGRTGVRRLNWPQENDRIQVRQFEAAMAVLFGTVGPDNRLKET